MIVNITLSHKGNKGKTTMIEDVEDDIDELPDSDFFKSAGRVYGNIDNSKSSVLLS